ncbi:MAG: hypothetical protein V4598_03510 [Bdellovibrionota bacterium]
MKFLLFFCLLIFVSFSRAFAFDVTLLQNNKEANSRIVTKKDRANLTSWVEEHRLGDQLAAKAASVFRATMIAYDAREAQCDVGMASLLITNAKNAGVMIEDTELRNLLIFLREQNQMDDILLNIFLKSDEVRFDIANAGRWIRPKTPRNLMAPANVDMKKYFSYINGWPDDNSYCSIGRYFRMAEMLTFKTKTERDNMMWKMAHIGLRDGVIDALTFHRLEALRLNYVLDWDHYSYNYLEMISSAKDKLAKQREVISTNTFSERYVSRKEKLTQRGRLYKTYSPTQVMIMASVIEKLSKRMDARRVELIFQYGAEQGTDTQIYVLSPMEQYRVSIKMMKKEMAELMRGDLFKNTGISYEDIIASSFETGLIKSSELDQILKFEEFWNPKAPSRFRTYAQFAFSLAGTATFYLPPPWNLVGAVALMFSQSRLMPTTVAPDADDNWNVII